MIVHNCEHGILNCTTCEWYDAEPGHRRARINPQRADLETIRKALYSGQVSAAKVDAQRAFERVVARLNHYQRIAEPTPPDAPLNIFNDVKAWGEHALRIGRYVAGGGPPPPRTTFLGQEGFWVSETYVRGLSGVPGMYFWCPDEIAERDPTGKFRAGMKSPGSGPPDSP